MSEDAILLSLPRLDCGLCGYGGCKPYASALLSREAAIDRCTPGGQVVLETLAKLTDVKVDAFVPDMAKRALVPQIASIRKDECIGCYKCAEICPVDALIGAQGQLHDIIDMDCNGCGLCIPACPVDCIELLPSEDSFSSRYDRRTYYAYRQDQKASRVDSEVERKRQHYYRWKSAGGLGMQRRLSYIQQAQKRVQTHHDNVQTRTGNVGQSSDSVSNSQD